MNQKTKKLCIAALFIALEVVGSMLSFPVFGSKCTPTAHLISILSAIMLGPYYGTGIAFCASVIRNLTGLGSLMAFPGSMIGAFLSGILYKKTQKEAFALFGEVFGTSVLGGLCAYPIAILFLGIQIGEIAFYAYIIPFFISTFAGVLLAFVMLQGLKKTNVLKQFS